HPDAGLDRRLARALLRGQEVGGDLRRALAADLPGAQVRGRHEQGEPEVVFKESPDRGESKGVARSRGAVKGCAASRLKSDLHVQCLADRGVAAHAPNLT